MSVGFICSDALSGIASCTGPAVVSGEGAGQSVSGTAVDGAGNSGRTTYGGINIDKTAPTISGVADRAANASGWYGADVTVAFTCADALSGVATCGAPVTLRAEGAGQSVSGAAVDRAGNSAGATVSGISIDKTAPAVSYAGNAGTYEVDQEVSITCSAADALSGVASSTCRSVVGPAYGFALGTNAFSAEATDRAGNTGSGSTSFAVGVTAESLCALTRRFVGGPGANGISNALCAKLSGPEAAAGRGTATADENGIEAYVHGVTAQAGKALTVDQAAILTRLAWAL